MINFLKVANLKKFRRKITNEKIDDYNGCMDSLVYNPNGRIDFKENPVLK